MPRDSIVEDKGSPASIHRNCGSRCVLVWSTSYSTRDSLAKIIANNSGIPSAAALSSRIFAITNTSFSFWRVVPIVKPALSPSFARLDRICDILIEVAPFTIGDLVDLCVPATPVPTGCCICCCCDDLPISHICGFGGSCCFISVWKLQKFSYERLFRVHFWYHISQNTPSSISYRGYTT